MNCSTLLGQVQILCDHEVQLTQLQREFPVSPNVWWNYANFWLWLYPQQDLLHSTLFQQKQVSSWLCTGVARARGSWTESWPWMIPSLPLHRPHCPGNITSVNKNSQLISQIRGQKFISWFLRVTKTMLRKSGPWFLSFTLRCWGSGSLAPDLTPCLHLLMEGKHMKIYEEKCEIEPACSEINLCAEFGNSSY